MKQSSEPYSNHTHLAWHLTHASAVPPCLVVCRSAQEARNFVSYCKAFSEDGSFSHSLLTEWDCLPYDRINPSPEYLSQTARCLNELNKQSVTVVSIGALFERFPPQEIVGAHQLQLKVLGQLAYDTLMPLLTSLGYTKIDALPQMPGEFAQRGNIIDIYAYGYRYPIRIELRDDIIQKIYAFDIQVGSVIESVPRITLSTHHWYTINPATIEVFKENYRAHFPGIPVQDTLYKEAISGSYQESFDHFFPLFHRKTSSIFDYINQDITCYMPQDTTDCLQVHASYIDTCYAKAQYHYHRRPLPPSLRYLAVSKIESQLVIRKTKLILVPNPPIAYTIEDIQNYQLKNKAHTLLFSSPHSSQVREYQKKFQDAKVFELSDTHDFIDDANSIAHFTLIGAPNKEEEDGIEQLASRKILNHLPQLVSGDFVIHKKYGVGKYLGLENISSDVDSQECITIEFEGQARLLLPVADFHLVSFYAHRKQIPIPVLDSLNKSKFAKSFTKIKKDTVDYAATILDLQSKRRRFSKQQRYTLQANSFQTFNSSFVHTITPDQQRAIDATFKDMYAHKVMDRIICGDVGFGKTEVALRACFLAVTSGYSVLWIAPTTLLVEQHAQTIKERFFGQSVKIFQLSRIAQRVVSPELIQEIKSTAPAIVVGTHRLLQKYLTIKNPGLLVIDEEQKFGVIHKNALLETYPGVDVLTLTATPIPRTLNLGLTGLKEFSLIATAPPSRKPVHTFCAHFNSEFIVEALQRERNRGGQIFIVVNTITRLSYWQDIIQQLAPDFEIMVAHGRMKAKTLEDIMFRFSNNEFPILMSTTIIESGIDIPNANTLIVLNADYFSTIQLHQLRGRVGRSHQQAIALFVADTKQGLQSLEPMKESFLGAGFQLSLKDLEHRGAGDLLGKKQSGNMNTLGTELYLDLLSSAIDDLKSNKDPFVEETTVKYFEPAFIPESYCPHPSIRLGYYRTLSRAASQNDISLLSDELLKKYGDQPITLQNLISISFMRVLASKHGVKELYWQKKLLVIELLPEHTISIEKLIALATNPQKKYDISLKTDGSIEVHVSQHADARAHYRFFKDLLSHII